MKQFIFSFGIHGSGHHMMNDLLQPLLFDDVRNQKTYNINFDRQLRGQMNSFYSNSNKDKFRNTSQFNDFLKNKIKKKLDNITKRGYEYFYYSSSYTFGSPLNIYNQPSLVDIFKIIEQIDNLSLKLVFLNRNIKDCTKSVIRRKFDKNSFNASYITHLAALEVENSIDFLKANKVGYFEIKYEEIKNDSIQVINELISFLNLDPKDVDFDGFKNFDHKIKKDKIIDDFFERRIYKYIDNN